MGVARREGGLTMREILFRGKRIDNGEWCEGGYYLEPYTDRTYIVCWNSFGLGFIEHIEVNRDTVGQYTEMKDRNGVRIFEGDIAQEYYSWKIQKKYGKKYQVSMDNERGGWFPFASGDGCGCCEEDTRNPLDCEIIGNVHDNPELMEV